MSFRRIVLHVRNLTIFAGGMMELEAKAESSVCIRFLIIAPIQYSEKENS